MDELLRTQVTLLLARGQRGMALGLDRVEDALRALGGPHLVAPAIVVAGTNGKGSVCAMLESIARTGGLRVGLTTSPHLSRFAERIRIDGAPIADEAFAAALGRVIADARDDLTFFETLTCAAFVAFAGAKVELAILEVGLGGRLDATNVVPRPLATAVVTIAEGDGRDGALEHAAILGGTVEAIAREKAGIFRRGVPAVIGRLGDRARGAVLEVAREVGVSDVIEVTREEAREGTTPMRLAGHGRISLGFPDGLRVVTIVGLKGAHQWDNAAVAAATAWCAGASMPALRQATTLGHGLAATTWPGRLERLIAAEPVARDGDDAVHFGSEVGSGHPAPRSRVAIFLDAAHNLDGARVLAAAWRTMSIGMWRPGTDAATRTILVFGALADKAYEPLLRELAPLAHRRIYTSPKGRQPAPLEALAAIAPGESIDDPASAMARALERSDPGDAILVAGSIYLVGEIRAHLLGEARDPPVAL